MHEKSSHTRGIISGMVTAISYGTNPLFAMPMILAGISVNSVLFYRYFFATLIYGAILTLIKKHTLRISLREFAALVFLALLFSFSSITLFGSFQYIDTGVSCTILFVYPSLVAIISALFFGEKLTRSTIIAIIIATIGVALLSSGSPHSAANLSGVFLALASALLYALYIVCVRYMKALHRVPNDTLNFYVMLIGLMVYVGNLHFCTELQALPTPLLWGCALLLAIIPTIISLETLTLAIKLIGSTKAAILGALEPLTALLIGISLFGEQLSWLVVSGFLLIISGVILIVASPSSKKRSCSEK